MLSRFAAALQRVRAALRAARSIRVVRPLIETADRIWWARTILRADVVDPDLIAAAGYSSPRSAVRAYVRGGFRKGMSLNPLLMEKLVASQLSDVGRVPALYAYLVNNRQRVRTSVNWDATAYAETHPESLDDPAGPLGHQWRSARATGEIVLGVNEARTVPWSAVLAAATRTPRSADAVPTLSTERKRVIICEVGEDEPDLAFTLDMVIGLAEDGDTDVILALETTSRDDLAACHLLALWLPHTITLRGFSELRSLLPPRPDGVVLVRAPRAELSADDARGLLTEGVRGAVGPLWLDTDGTVASAGLIVRNGRYRHLFEGHPPEDARAAGALLEVAGLAAGTYALPLDGRPAARQARTLTSSLVRTVRSPAPAGFVDAPDTELTPYLRRAGFVADTRTSGAPRLQRLQRTHTLADGTVVPVLRWAVKIAAPPGRFGEYWGDTHFARGIAEALRRLGQEVVIDAYAAQRRSTSYLDDVVLALRGPEPLEAQTGAHSLLWIISHPDEITAKDLDGFASVFAASTPWAALATERFGVPVHALLQCTDGGRFRPSGLPRTKERVFVGTARGISRPSVVEPLRAGIPVSVYGPDWTGWIPAQAVVARSVPNDRLSAMYESADAVLNDHWPAMQRAGFISNRLFDVVAAGGRAISDRVVGMEEIFQGSVREYESIPELLEILRSDLDSVFPSQDALTRIGDRIRQDHSFDARARTLLDAALKGR
ncbi:glycosyltransferase [Microbacterium sp. P06]|uniref:glycosyltransferase family protein n=1 Tax=Microbacterium sp. P06 TaxID=3366949 RepID=UPI0037458994